MVPKKYHFHNLPPILPTLQKHRTTVKWTWCHHQNAKNKGLFPPKFLANLVPELGPATIFVRGHSHNYITTTQQLEGQTSYIMWLFQNMLHFTKPTNSSYIHCFFLIDKMSLQLDEMVSWAGLNGFAGLIWPGGRSLETPESNKDGVYEQ